MIKLKHCKQADIDHIIDNRVYCHTNHYPEVICYAKAFKHLPQNNKLAILLHEVGHIYTNYSTEAEANDWVKKMFGIRIYYVDTKYCRKLETIEQIYINYAKDILHSYINLNKIL